LRSPFTCSSYATYLSPISEAVLRYVCGFKCGIPTHFQLNPLRSAYVTYYWVTNHLQHYKRYSTGVRRLRHPLKGSVMRTSSKSLALLTVTRLRTDFAALLLWRANLNLTCICIYLKQKETIKKPSDF
jgi:hypothetical protein